MRNLEQSVGMHRRLEGVGKSKPGENVGTFDFHWAHNRHSANRKVVCIVSRGEGWECLTILMLDEKGSKKMWERPALHSEVQRLLPLFFLPDELVIQFHEGKGGRARSGLDFWRRTSITDQLPPLPEFGPHFSLAKTQPTNESQNQEPHR